MWLTPLAMYFERLFIPKRKNENELHCEYMGAFRTANVSKITVNHGFLALIALIRTSE